MSKKKTQVWGNRLHADPDKLSQEYCTGRDVRVVGMCDEKLIAYDIWTNLAHCQMLHEGGVLTAEEWQKLHRGLFQLDDLHGIGGFQLDPAKEDVHINIEHWLTHTKGIVAAKKMHSGRSRNDQVSCDMRLYLRNELSKIAESLHNLVERVLNLANEHRETVMPGFTHYQPAMITTLGHWMLGWAQGLLRDMQALGDVYDLINKCPLGAAAGFGTSWPINRERTAELLGFDGVEENSLDAISSRGEAEARIASVIAVMMNRLSQIGQDLILWSHPYFNFVKISDAFVTGSSIMPQKRNPDFAEVTRAKAAYAAGTVTSLLGLQKGAMSGYNRDSQQSKSLIMDLFAEVLEAPFLFCNVIGALEVNAKVMEQRAKEGYMNAADLADGLAREHKMSFREAYDVVSLAVKYSEQSSEISYAGLLLALKKCGLERNISPEWVHDLNDPLRLLAQKKHTGAPSPQAVAAHHTRLEHEMKVLKEKWDMRNQRVDEALERAHTTP